MNQSTIGLINSRLIAVLALCVSALVKADSLNSVTEDTFGCIRDMTPVRGFYVDNISGDIDGTVAVAKSSVGGRYPEGSIVQLVPTEAMVKGPLGSSPATNDWEFFELDVSTAGTEIKTRGYVDVVNRFGGNCFACHVKAEPKWDLLCESDHGCDPIPLSRTALDAIQKTDPRCDAVPLSDQEMAALKALMKTASSQ